VKRLVAGVLVCVLAPAFAAPATVGGAAKPQFVGKSSKIDHARAKRMKGRSWHRGCPVPISQLRLLRVRHWDFKGEIERGRLIVNEAADREILRVMEDLFDERFPIRRMEVIDAYGGDDHKSMNADNTSAFNCRFVAGTQRWSEHAFGRAIDLNPIENPYVTTSGHVSPPAGRPYADRTRDARGMTHRGDPTVRAFKSVGWKWGGNWSGTRDFQHFSVTGS